MRPGRLCVLLIGTGIFGCGAGEGLPGGGLGPALSAVSPGLASTNSIVRLSGAELAGTEVRVFFDETEGVVLHGDDTEIWATGIPGNVAMVGVAAIVDGLPTNTLPLVIAPSGTLRPLAENGLESPRGLVLDVSGALVWIFDETTGVHVFSIANGAYRVHRSPSAELLQPVTGLV